MVIHVESQNYNIKYMLYCMNIPSIYNIILGQFLWIINTDRIILITTIFKSPYDIYPLLRGT